ncbi:MAG: ester cyclase [Actinobacteria bacterium]|nr:ester cyclase [Actinomycetota bacterium]
MVEGNQVVTKWHLTGTQTGELEGMPPSNKKVSVDGVSIDQIENGQIVSGFDAWDSLNFRKQLGLPI